jgi:putative endonuclease
MTTPLNASRDSGFAVENQVQKHLEEKGLTLLIKNFQTPVGEIDLIMKDNTGRIIFIEVRARNNQFYGNGLESVDRRKRQKIVRTAQLYLQKHGLLDKVYCRFDVVATTRDNHGKILIDWIQNAFMAGE